MRSGGRDLNEIVDGGDSRQNFQKVLAESLSLTDISPEQSSGFTFMHKLSENVLSKDCEQKSQSSILEKSKSPPEFFVSHKYQANIQLIKAESRLIRITNELKDLYNANPNGIQESQCQSSLHDNYATRTTLRIRTATTFRSSPRSKLSSETDDSKLMSYYETVKQNLQHNCQQEVPPFDVKFNDMLELMVKYNDHIKLKAVRTSRRKVRTSRSPLRSRFATNRNDLKGAIESIARNKEIFEELRNKEMQFHEPLRYVAKADQLRSQLKTEQSWTKALLHGTYSALQRYTRSPCVLRVRGSFELFKKMCREYTALPSTTGASLVSRVRHASK